VIEVDGSSHVHENAQKKDSIRDEKFDELGLSVLRFGEAEVRNQMENVLEKINVWIIEKESGENKVAQQKSPFLKGDTGGF
jgi:very-short-patch-repair endonuclease